MRFLIDAQLPPALTAWIGARGHPASAVRNLGLRESDDGSIFNFAREQQWILVTKDEDFVERCLGVGDAPQVVWTHRQLYESQTVHNFGAAVGRNPESACERRSIGRSA